MVEVFCHGDDDSFSVEIDWSLVNDYNGLKSALQMGVQQWRADNDNDNPENEPDDD